MRKKIAILATYVGEVNRGAETFVIELSKYLMKHYDVDIYSSGTNQNLRGCLVSVSIEKPAWLVMHEWCYRHNKIYRIFCNKLYWIIPSEIFQYFFNKKVYKEYLQEKCYDLVFVNNGAWGTHYAKKLRDLKGTPFMFTGHGGIGKGEALALADHPDTYVALSKVQLEWARRTGERVVQISNGVDCAHFVSNKEKKEKTMRTVLVVAALTKFKRQKLTIDAVALLENVSLLLLGKGELADTLRIYGKKKLPGRFEIKAVPYAEVVSCYQAADVFTLPSLNEPFGIVYLEAMAAGLPVVAPNDELRRSLVGDAGILCECENAESYAQALQKALDTDWGKRPEMQAAKFDWQIIAEKYMEVMDELMNGGE